MKAYILIPLTLINFTCIAQTIPDPTGYEARENIRELGSQSGTGNVRTFDNRYEGTKGTPYVNEAWYSGEIYLKNKNRVAVKEMNYNCYDNEVAFLDPDTRSVRLINKYTVDFFYLLNASDTMLFVPIEPENDGDFLFARVLYNGGSTVYKRYEKEFVKANYEGGYSADRKYDEFADKSSLYFRKHNDQLFYKAKTSKKKILEAFPEAENELSAYLKAEKPDMKIEEDLVKLLKYYDSLSAE